MIVTVAKILSVSFALAWAHTTGAVGALVDFLPQPVEDTGAEVLLIAALLGLARLMLTRSWRFAKKANHAYDVLMDSAERHERNEESISEVQGSMGRIEARLHSGAERMGRIEVAAEGHERRMGRMEAALEVLADEDRMLIQRRLTAEIPERRLPHERRDPPPGA